MEFAVASILALLAGLVAGWFFGSRPVGHWRAQAETREREARETDARYLRAFADLEAARERAGRADELSLALDHARAEHRAETDRLRQESAAILDRTRNETTALLEKTRAEHAFQIDALRREQRELASELATLREKSANFDEQKRLLLEAQETLRKEFENAGAKVLEGAQEAFLRRAGARFEESEKASAERIATILAPVGQRLRSYEEQVAALEEKRTDAFGKLHGQIEALRVGQELVRNEALRLGNSLRNAPKARGRWGEQQLKNVLEQCGLTEHTDFATEQSIDTEDGRLRPDAIVRIPGNKQLVIDAKVSLNAYQDAFEAEDETLRIAFLDQHAASMRAHIQALGNKSYQSQFENAPDYVIMFVPGEHFIAAALDHDSGLWDYAFDRRVLLASPTNLVAIARTIAQVWQQEGLAREAREIGKLGSDLYDSLAKTQDDLGKVGMHLGRAVNSFNDFARTYEGNVMSRARRLGEKHIKIGKREISDDVPSVDAAPRFSEASRHSLPAAEVAE
ncbi:DNA recombination protein RmuC [Novosphingobium sp. FGD1]|jgi:DNA recombination protein RmuC|uniref:DNA recombination protein RmuC homolog n=1 Tax=Novosphingobium silvae TaxID=2692619 RepID=A0A7X4K750_9SPHN|nr:DNA recombination protein RmuC [Novosphingobium silvae]MYL96908.1 DNA recombination protein RmuC [Novosphingobium silvae]